MHSKVFVVELTREESEFDVYDALERAGMKYSRVRPMGLLCPNYPKCKEEPRGTIELDKGR